MSKASVNVAASWEVRVDIDVDKVINALEDFEVGIQEAVEAGIYDWLYELRKYALIHKPWQDRTRALRAAHEIVSIPDGYALEVDARKTSGKNYNYAYALEKGWLKQYKWLEPAVINLEPELVKIIEEKMENLIDAIDKDYKLLKMRGSRGKEFTMLQHPAGTVDPVTGKKLGGRFVRKL